MEYVNKYLSKNSQKNISQINFTNENLLNQHLINTFKIYKNFFNKTTTKIYSKKYNFSNKYKKIFVDFYTDFVDNNIDNNYDFLKNLENTKYVHEIFIEGLEMFKFFVYDSDIQYISKILHIFNIFTNFVFSESHKKEYLLKRLIRNSNLEYVDFNKIDKYLFNIYIFPNKLKRKVAGDLFISEHLDIYKKTNTAFTTSGVTSYNMLLTKKEELSKLFLHELIHLYKLDGIHSHETKFLEEIKQKMPFLDYNSERETVAELMSNIYNCMNLCLITSSDYNLNEYQELNLLNLLLNIEKEYSVVVVSKILKYFNIKPDELFNYNKSKVELVSPINLYYIFRSILYYRLNDFFQSKNLEKKNILEINENIYSDLKQYIYEAINSIYMNKLNYYYDRINIMSNPNVSYITLDIDFDKVVFPNIKFYEYEIQIPFLDKFKGYIKQLNSINQSGGNINYYNKYIKYKRKYLRLFMN